MSNTAKPATSKGKSSRAHSKRAWAKDMMELIQDVQKSESGLPVQDTLPHIILVGHDRGGRLAYRMALDFPLEVAGLAVLDIVPTVYMWDNMRLENGLHAETRASNHWVSCVFLFYFNTYGSAWQYAFLQNCTCVTSGDPRFSSRPRGHCLRPSYQGILNGIIDLR